MTCDFMLGMWGRIPYFERREEQQVPRALSDQARSAVGVFDPALAEFVCNLFARFVTETERLREDSAEVNLGFYSLSFRSNF